MGEAVADHAEALPWSIERPRPIAIAARRLPLSMLAFLQYLAPTLAFLIGGHLGLDEPTLAAASERLALARLTLTHELSRLVLLEQLYRAMTIKTGHPYHV